MAMATKNAAPMPSRDLVKTTLVPAAEAVALVLTAEAAAALKVDDANGGNDGSAAINGGASLAMGGGVIN
jgi:hypothetical protein